MQKRRDMRNVRLLLLWYSVACGRQLENSHRHVGSARASPLAFSPVGGQPRHFSDLPKNGEKCEMAFFVSMALCLVFGFLCCHTVSNPITTEMHTRGVQKEGSPEAPDRIERHSCNGPETHECCIEGVLFYVSFDDCCFEDDVHIRRYTKKRSIELNKLEQEQIYYEF